MSDKKPEAERVSAIAPFGLRMLPELRERVAEAAAANGRSMNAEIVARLEGSFNQPAAATDIEAFAESFGTQLMEAMRRSLWRATVGAEAEIKPSGLGLLEFLRANHIYESQVLQEERMLLELQAMDFENRERIRDLQPKAREEWKKSVRRRLPKDQAERIIKTADWALAKDGQGSQDANEQDPPPTGPATDAVDAMDAAIAKDRKRGRSKRS